MTKAFLFVSAALVLFLSTDHRRQAVAAAPPEEKPKKPAITPQVEKITLTIDGRDLKPVRTKSPWQLEYVAGEQHIILDGKKLQATGGAKKWTVEAPDGQRLYWLAADRAIAYLG